MIIFLIFGLLLGVLIIIFTLQNLTDVTVSFLTWHAQGSLALVLVIAVTSGIVLCLLFLLPEIIKKRLQNSSLKKQINELENKVLNKNVEINEEKSKVASTNAYLDDLEKTTKV